MVLDVYAINKEDSTGILENIEIGYTDDILSDLYVTYTIQNDNDEVIIVSNIFKELSFINKDYINDIKVHININSNKYFIKEINFDHLDYLINNPNRNYLCFNDALVSLNTDYNKDVINWKLFINGYYNLDNYYIDYYNKKYNLNITNVLEMPYYVLNDIFSGECIIDYDNLSSIHKVADSYLFNNVFYIKWNDNIYGLNDLLDTSFIQSNPNFIVGYNEEYMHDSLKDYGYNIYMDIILNKKEEVITPPKTGI